MRTALLVLAAIFVANCPAFSEATIANGSMDGTPVDHSEGKDFLVTPPSWTPVNIDAARGDRLSVEASDRPGAGPCLHVKTFATDAGVYQTLSPLVTGRTYLLSAWVKRLSGALAIEAYSYAWGPAVMRVVDSSSSGWRHVSIALTPVDAGAHLYLVASPSADFLIDDLGLQPAPIQVDGPELLPYDLGASKSYRFTLSTQPDAAFSADVIAQAVDNSTGQTHGAPVRCSVATAKPAVATVAIPLEAEGTFALRVTDAASGVLLGGSHDVRLTGSPWDVHFPYKNSLYSSLGYRWPVRINLLGAQAATLRTLSATIALSDSSGKSLRRIDATRTATGLEVNLDGRGLDPGDYRLGLLVRGPTGRTVHVDTCPLRILPPDATEVVVGPSGDTLVNGRRFFPIGLYWVLADPAGWLPGPARKTADLQDLRQAGFNTLHTYAFEHSDANDTDDNALAYLDMAHDLGFMVMMGIRRDWYQGDVSVNLEAVERRVLRLKDHPALLCWTLWDEPNFSEGVAPRVQALYDTVNKADPYHPAMPVFGGPSGRAFRDATDVDLFDSYPGAGNAGVLPQVFDWAHASMPDKPIWFVAQSYKQAVLPSEQDMRLFCRYALDAGSKAIFWYSYGGDGKDWDSIRITPEFYATVKRVIRELADKVHEP